MNPYGAPPPHPGSVYKSATSTDTADHTIIASRGGFQFMMTLLVLNNAHASQDTGATIKGGTGGAWGPIPAASKGGGCVIRFDPPFPVLTDTDLAFAASDSASVTASAGGYWTAKGGF